MKHQRQNPATQLSGQFSLQDTGEQPDMPSPLTYFDSATKAELEKLDLRY